MNKKTVSLNREQYENIIRTMGSSFTGCRPNKRIATALILEANLGMRISDVLNLHPADIVFDGGRYHLNIIEQKTGKRRTFTVTDEVQRYITEYCAENNIAPHDRIFDLTVRAVQKHLKTVCDYLGYDGISTHSFRKFFATEIYQNSGYNIELVRELLQHSSTTVTQRYIGIGSVELENAIAKHQCLISL